jgi:antibiotic biosynthesis monooxygenase (ABM) superfamily enzyme
MAILNIPTSKKDKLRWYFPETSISRKPKATKTSQRFKAHLISSLKLFVAFLLPDIFLLLNGHYIAFSIMIGLELVTTVLYYLVIKL